jgi:hypothetical protein
VNFNRIIPYALAVCLVPATAEAHNRFEISAGAGLRWGGSGDAEYKPSADQTLEGKLRIDPAFAYGFQLGYRAQPDGFAYLAFSRQVADVHLDGDDQDNLVKGKLAIEYYLLGGNVEWTRGRWVPYLGAAMGASRWVSVGGYGSRLFFTAALDGGLKFDLFEHVHLRLSGRLPITMAHGDIFCASESSCLEFPKLTPQVQGEALLGAGVSF